MSVAKSQSLTVRSSDADAISLPSGENATALTQSLRPQDSQKPCHTIQSSHANLWPSCLRYCGWPSYPWKLLCRTVAGSFGKICDSRTPSLISIKLRRKLEDIQDLLVVDEVGLPRANRIPVKGLGKASIMGQGINKSEAEELAICAVCIATRALMYMKRECKQYSKLNYDSTIYGGSSDELEEVLIGLDLTSVHNPIQTHVSIPALALWWDCSEIQAKTLYDHAIELPMFLGDQKWWDKVEFGKLVIGKIAKFEASRNQAQLYNTTLGPCSRGDYTKLLRHLTSQIVLISFLRFNGISGSQIRVRSTCNHPEPHQKINQQNFDYFYHWTSGCFSKLVLLASRVYAERSCTHRSTFQ